MKPSIIEKIYKQFLKECSDDLVPQEHLIATIHYPKGIPGLTTGQVEARLSYDVSFVLQQGYINRMKEHMEGMVSVEATDFAYKYEEESALDHARKSLKDRLDEYYSVSFHVLKDKAVYSGMHVNLKTSPSPLDTLGEYYVVVCTWEGNDIGTWNDYVINLKRYVEHRLIT